MKHIHIAIIVLTISITISCTHTTNLQTHASFNQEITGKNGQLILVGQCTRERLQQAPFGEWFNKNYEDYTPDTAITRQLKPLLQHKKLLLFMGTWCGDSRREVPRIYKLLDDCGATVQLVNVSNHDSAYKQSPTHEEQGLNIIRVPTLLISDRTSELGRIVETPVVSWEKDLLAILRGEPYTPHYSH